MLRSFPILFTQKAKSHNLALNFNPQKQNQTHIERERENLERETNKMLPVKLVRSLVLGESINNPFHTHHHHDDDNDNDNGHDADDEHDKDTHHHHHHHPKPKDCTFMKNKKIPMLLFVPTRELITDTFRLASIARDIGMDFHPSSSLSHLIFSWPSPSSSSSSSPSPSSSSSSKITSLSSSSSSSISSSSFLLPNDAVPLPFPSLSTPTVSLSLLRFFVSLSRGLFKLVFLDIGPDSEFERNWVYDDCPNLSLFARVSGFRVGSMDDLSRVLAGHGWALFRTRKELKDVESVYLFQKKDCNRVRVGVQAKGGNGECRIRELRLPTLDFRNGVPLRILLYILLMTDDIFYIA